MMLAEGETKWKARVSAFLSLCTYMYVCTTIKIGWEHPPVAPFCIVWVLLLVLRAGVGADAQPWERSSNNNGITPAFKISKVTSQAHNLYLLFLYVLPSTNHTYAPG